jgi:TIR domain
MAPCDRSIMHRCDVRHELRGQERSDRGDHHGPGTHEQLQAAAHVDAACDVASVPARRCSHAGPWCDVRARQPPAQQRRSQYGDGRMGDPPSVRVFISYRREDTAGYAGRLYDALAARMGDVDVFMDVSDIEPGADFSVAIADAVGSCDVLLALIGTRWATAVNADGTRRLDDPDDYVVVETAEALERDVRVIPVLIEGASMPEADALPERLHGLARRNAVQLSTVSWRTDLEPLVAALQRLRPRSAAPDAPAWGDLAPSAAARAGATPVEPVAPGAGHPRRRRRLVWAAVVAAGALAAVLIVVAVAGDGDSQLVDRDARLRLEPTSGPAGTTIGVSGDPCPLPDGWGGGQQVFFGLNDPEYNNPDKDELMFIANESWSGELTVPADAPSGAWGVYANCYADDPDGEWSKFYDYPEPPFEVTAP